MQQRRRQGNRDSGKEDLYARGRPQGEEGRRQGQQEGGTRLQGPGGWVPTEGRGREEQSRSPVSRANGRERAMERWSGRRGDEVCVSECGVAPLSCFF